MAQGKDKVSDEDKLQALLNIRQALQASHMQLGVASVAALPMTHDARMVAAVVGATVAGASLRSALEYVEIAIQDLQEQASVPASAEAN